jgi:hypothetical protein
MPCALKSAVGIRPPRGPRWPPGRFAPARCHPRRRKPPQPRSATATARFAARRGNPCWTSADCHVSDKATAALAEGVHWLRMTAPVPYSQRSVALPVSVTMSSQLMTCSPRTAVHNELQTKGSAAVDGRGGGSSQARLVLKAQPVPLNAGARLRSRDVHRIPICGRLSRFAAIVGARYPVECEVKRRCWARWYTPHVEPSAAVMAAVEQAGFLHIRRVTLQSHRAADGSLSLMPQKPTVPRVAAVLWSCSASSCSKSTRGASLP